MSLAPSTTAIFEVLIAILIEIQVVSNFAPCRLANNYRRFGEVWCLHPQCLIALLDPKDGDGMLLRNVGSLFKVLVILIHSVVSVRDWWLTSLDIHIPEEKIETSVTNNPTTQRYIQKPRHLTAPLRKPNTVSLLTSRHGITSCHPQLTSVQ